MKKLMVLLCVSVMCFTGFVSIGFAQNSENLTITTYYPSPNGSYQDLVVNRRIEMRGMNNAGMGVPPYPPVLAASGWTGITWTASPNDTVWLHFYRWGANVDESQFRIEVGDNPNDSVYIGGNQNGLSGGTPGGLTQYANGDAFFNNNIAPSTAVQDQVYVQGDVFEKSPVVGQGCMRLSYGSNSHVTSCPGGLVVKPGVSPPFGAGGGIFYCCNY